MVLLPALTFLLVIILNDRITPMVAMGMLLVAACPGGNISNFMSSLSKANIELSVTLTALSTSLAPLTTPGNFALWGGLYVRYLNKQAAGALQPLEIPISEVMITVFILLGIPLILGLLTNKYLPKVSEKLKSQCRYFPYSFFF